MTNFEILVPTKCLSLLFFNFTQEDITELSKVREFEYAWNKYTNTKAVKKEGFISDKVFYELYTNVSYETQLAIMNRAMDRFTLEACRSIGCSVGFKEKATEFRNNIQAEKEKFTNRLKPIPKP